MGCFSGSQQSTKSSSESKSVAQKSAIDAGLGQVPGSFPGYGSYLGQGMNVYQGDRVAGMTQTGQDVLGQLPSFASQFGDLSGSPLQKQLESTSGSLLAGEMGAQAITPEQETAFFNQGIRDPRMKEFQRTELPGIQEAFAGPGYWGSARAGETAEAYGDVGDWLGQQRANLAYDTLGRNQQIQESQANRALGAIGPSLAVGQAPTQQALSKLGGLGQTMQLADTERVQQQAEIQASMGKFFEENQITDPQVMQAFAMLIGTPMNSSSSSGSASGPGLGYSAVSSFAGGFGKIAGGNLGGKVIPA